MLMNLTRMRNFGWEKYVIPIYQEYKTKITWGDQDIINIVFHFHPDKLYVYPCNYNFRPDHWYILDPYIFLISINYFQLIYQYVYERM